MFVNRLRHQNQVLPVQEKKKAGNEIDLSTRLRAIGWQDGWMTFHSASIPFAGNRWRRKIQASDIDVGPDYLHFIYLYLRYLALFLVLVPVVSS